MKIEIIVSPTGETNVQTKGFAGSSCRDASAFLEKALSSATKLATIWRTFGPNITTFFGL